MAAFSVAVPECGSGLISIWSQTAAKAFSAIGSCLATRWAIRRAASPPVAKTCSRAAGSSRAAFSVPPTTTWRGSPPLTTSAATGSTPEAAS